MTINGGTLDGQLWVQSVDDSAKLTITGGKFSPNGNDASSVFLGNVTTTGVHHTIEFAVTGGIFETKIGCNDVSKITGDKISGGKFTETAVNNTNVDLLATGMVFTEEVGADGYYGVTDFVPVAEVNGVQYATLAEAITYAQKDDTITLLADITENVTVDKSLTIDGAGKTYTGKINATASITIKNVNFDGKGMSGYAVETRSAKTVVIEDCTAKNYSYGFLQVASNNDTTTLKNVTITNVLYGVKIDYSNGVTLENVNITASSAGLLNSNYGAKTITIKDSYVNILGTWTRNNTTKTTYVFEGANTIDSFIIDAAIDNFKLAVGATLTAPNAITATATEAGYSVKYADGKYFVKANMFAIGEETYASLAEALDAAKAGDTLTFLADITEDVTISMAVTIDGAGKTYTGAMTLKADTTIKNVNFDGKGYDGYAITTRGANYLTIEDCTAQNYGYGFVQLASGTALTTVKNVIVSNMNYGVKAHRYIPESLAVSDKLLTQQFPSLFGCSHLHFVLAILRLYPFLYL